MSKRVCVADNKWLGGVVDIGVGSQSDIEKASECNLNVTNIDVDEGDYDKMIRLYHRQTNGALSRNPVVGGRCTEAMSYYDS